MIRSDSLARGSRPGPGLVEVPAGDGGLPALFGETYRNMYGPAVGDDKRLQDLQAHLREHANPLLAAAAPLLGLILVHSQWSALSRFAASHPRRNASWRDGDLDWRRSEESRRAELTTIVNQIAHDRFAFPNDDNPEFQTYVNLPEPQMAVQVQGGVEKLLPDIVVLDKPGGRPRLIAQVESRETMTREQAEYVWARLEMRDAPLLLYVPSGMAATARDYAKAAGIKNAKVRTWRRLPQGAKVLELN